MKGLIINHQTKFLKELKILFSGLSVDIVDHGEFNKEIAEKYDFVVLSGGPIHISGGNDIVEEKEFLRNTNKPVLGICLGLQILAITFGSKLFELESKKYGFFDFEIFNKKGRLRYINKWFIKDLPENFTLLSKGKEGIEAIQHKTKPILALQGHPELSGEYGKTIRDLFLENFAKTKRPVS